MSNFILEQNHVFSVQYALNGKNKFSPNNLKTAMVKEKTTSIDTKDTVAVGQLYLLSALVQREGVMELLKKVVSSKAKISKEENLGKKTLAYPINKHRELTLLSIFFVAEPKGVQAIEKELHLEEEIERYLITSWSAELPKEDTHNSTVERVKRSRF